MENSHVTLMCNEIASSSEIAWFKDTKLLKSLYGYGLDLIQLILLIPFQYRHMKCLFSSPILLLEVF